MKIRTLPLTLVLLCHLIALGLFLGNVGVQYPPGNRLVLLAYVLCLAVATVMGYSVGLRIRPASGKTLTARPAIWGLALNALLLLPTIRAYTGGSFGEFFHFLMDPGYAYNLMSAKVAQGRDQRLWLILLQSVASPLVVTTLPCLGFLYFRYRRHGKLLLMASTILLIGTPKH